MLNQLRALIPNDIVARAVGYDQRKRWTKLDFVQKLVKN
jgi:hypothetical protein